MFPASSLFQRPTILIYTKSLKPATIPEKQARRFHWLLLSKGFSVFKPDRKV